jgi:Helix-turn-helix domain
MGHRLRMTAELGEWLAELGGPGSGGLGSDSTAPAAAVEVGACLVAIMQAEDPAGLPFVGKPADAGAVPDPREALDYTHQLLLERLREVRLQYAELAATRQHLADELDQERAAAEPDSVRIGDVRRRLDDARERENALAAGSERLRAAVSSFSARKETAKAMYTAVEARRRIDEALAAAGLEPEEGDVTAAAEQARASFEQARDEAHRLLGTPPPEPGRQENADLLEMRADELGTDIRVLFAIEPEGTVTALAVLEGTDAISEHRDDALRLAGQLLEEIRGDGWPPDDAGDPGLEFAGPAPFLEKFLPGRDRVVAERASAVAAAVSLRGLRDRRDLTLAQLAHRTGSDSSDLAELERGTLRSAAVDELARYVQALGGTLRLTVTVDGVPHDLV